MSTWYRIASEAKLRKNVTKDEVEKAIQATGLPCIGSDGSLRGDDQFFVEERDSPQGLRTNKDGFPHIPPASALYMVLGVDNSMSYNTANQYDEKWIELVKKYADFDNGAVEVNSGGDDYEGTKVWYIGPQKKIFAAQLAAIDAKLAELNEKRIELADHAGCATDEIVDSLFVAEILRES